MEQNDFQPPSKPNRNLEWRPETEAPRKPEDPLIPASRGGSSSRSGTGPGGGFSARGEPGSRAKPKTRADSEAKTASSPQMGTKLPRQGFKHSRQGAKPLHFNPKQWIQDFWELYRSRIVVAVALAVVGLIAAGWFISNFNSSQSHTDPVEVIPIAQPVATQPPLKDIVVHIAGAVTEPGVYSLSSDARVHHLVARAGGPTPTADTDSVNLAQPLTDGIRICIPDTTDLTGCASSFYPSQGQNSPAQQLVNPNTASRTELESLPGIGPALASEIETYRQQGGRFRTAEDMLEIAGIGPETLKRFQDRLVFP